uniref:Uncharacterized protein n=1 Tax=Candidatus Kentrum sp. DK TaxID=2126562 RepID=A0A450SK18_9GAMM|nr:MAG: hypothetical protein BECKDK2373B_GA0170837_10445 [Candidatus Kentron sp. DK]
MLIYSPTRQSRNQNTLVKKSTVISTEGRDLVRLEFHRGRRFLAALEMTTRSFLIVLFKILRVRDYKPRFLASFRLVMKHDPCFCMRLTVKRNP